MRVARKKEGPHTSLDPRVCGTDLGSPRAHGPLLGCNPSLSAARLQTPRLGHAQRYLNVRFRAFGIFSATNTRIIYLRKERVKEGERAWSRTDLWFRRMRWGGERRRRRGEVREKRSRKRRTRLQRYKDSHLSRKSTLTRSRRCVTECPARTAL